MFITKKYSNKYCDTAANCIITFLTWACVAIWRLFRDVLAGHKKDLDVLDRTPSPSVDCSTVKPETRVTR